MNRAGPKEIVQHLGWLFKRGEGYEGDEPQPAQSGVVSGPAQSNTLKKGFFKEFKEKLAQSSNTGKDATSPQNKTAEIAGEALNEAINGLERLLRGKGEKRRFFKLVTIEQRIGAESDTITPLSLSRNYSRGLKPSEIYEVRVELRYYNRESADAGSLKGVICLSPDCEVVTRSDDANFKLITPGRCYYLRPDGDATSGDAITVTYQWADSLRRQIRSLFAMQQILTRQASFHPEGGIPTSPLPSFGTPGSPLQTMGSSRARLLRAESVLPPVEAEQIPSTLTEVLADSTTRSDFREFLESALAIESLDFYEAVEKLERASAAEFAELAPKVLDEFVEAGSPHEVNLSSSQRKNLLAARKKLKLRDFDDAKQEVFKLMEDNFFKRFYRETLAKTGAFAALYATLGIDGFNAVLQHFGPVKTDLQRMLLTYSSRLKRAEAAIGLMEKELASSSREVAVANQSTTSRALLSAYRTTVTRLMAMSDYVDEMRNQVVGPLEALSRKIERDIQTIHRSVREEVTDLEECKKLIQANKAEYERLKCSNPSAAEQMRIQISEAEIALENAETKHSKPIEAAMAKFESLELYRIETQRQVAQYALLAEKNMMTEMAKAAKAFVDTIKKVEFDMDVRELSLGFQADLKAH